MQVLNEAGVQRFPTPFVEGFGWDESGELIFPNRPEVCVKHGFPVWLWVSPKLSRLNFKSNVPLTAAGSAEVWCARPCITGRQCKWQ